MIRNTHEHSPSHVVSAYSDNAAVLEGQNGTFLAPSYSTGEWTQNKEKVNFLAKVETVSKSWRLSSPLSTVLEPYCMF